MWIFTKHIPCNTYTFTLKNCFYSDYLLGISVAIKHVWTIFNILNICISDGQKSAPLQGRTPGRLSIQTLSCITWLLEYARLYAEKHPDTVSLDLPPCLTRKSVYQMMKEELNDQGVEVVSETYFISVVWKKYCSHIKIPPVCMF